MSLPTRDQLNDEVDRLFAQQFPDAPTRLDPDDPEHSSWIDAWLVIRDELLNDWVDEAFAGYFPDAGRLDPDDPDHAQLIDYWKDIRDQIRDGGPGRYSWNGHPDGDQQDLRATSVDHDPAGGWVVTFDRQISVEQAEVFLWPGGKPNGVRVVKIASNQAHLRGLSIDAVQTMNPEVAARIQPTVLTADPRTDPSSDPSSGSSPDTDIDVEMDETTEAQIAEWTEHVLHGGHALGSTAEVVEDLAKATAHIAGHAGKAAVVLKAAEVVSKVLGPVGHVCTVISAVYEVVDAFRSEKRRQHSRGFVYGVMWQALDEPDHIPAFDPGISYSAEELRAAFVQGVAEGRTKAQDPLVRNQVILAVATLGLSSGLGDFYAANEVLSQLWRATRERSPGDSDTDTIRWPVPYDHKLLGIP